MTGFSLRTAGPGDEAEITRLLEASYGQLMPAAYGAELTIELLPVISKAQPALLTSGSYRLAITAEGTIIGVGGRPGSGEVDGKTGHIRHVATDPRRIGEGVGRAIIDHCAIEARSAGMTRFECYASLNAVDFCSRLGFLKIRAIDVPVGGDLVMPSVLMERTL